MYDFVRLRLEVTGRVGLRRIWCIFVFRINVRVRRSSVRVRLEF